MSRYISSLSNPKVKEIVQLVSKSKVRKVFGVCIVEGRREVDRALACNWEMKELWTLENTEPVAGVPDTVDRYEVSAKVYEKIAYRDSTEDVVAVFYPGWQFCVPIEGFGGRESHRCCRRHRETWKSWCNYAHGFGRRRRSDCSS